MKSAYQQEVEAKLTELVSGAVIECGAELVELQFIQRKSSALLRILADKVGGISLDQCAEISRRVSFLLETADPIEGRYTLEVSSPGLDRPLTSRDDFRRKVGERVRLTVTEGERTREIEGELARVEDNRLSLITTAGEVGFPLEQVVRGKIIF